MWFIYSLLAALFFALSTFYFKKGFRNLSLAQTMWLETIVTVFVVGSYYFYRRDFSTERLLEVFILSIVATGVYAFYLLSYKKSQLSITSSIISASPLLLTFLAFWVLGQKVSWFGIILIIVTIVGVLMIGFDFQEIKKLSDLKKVKIKGYFKWALVGLLANTIMSIIAGRVLSYSTVTTYIVVLIPAEMLISIPLLKLNNESMNVFTNNYSKLLDTILGAVFMSLGTILYFEAFATGKIAYIESVTNFSVVISAFLGLVFLKEKITRLQFIGIGIVIIGVLLFGFVN